MSKRTANLAHAIHSFQSGDLTHHELFEQVDRALKSNKANSTRLQEILDDERTRVQLPPEVYAALHRRIEHLGERGPAEHGPGYRSPTEPKFGMTAGETRMLPQRGDNVTSPSSQTTGGYAPPDGEPERVKGVGDTLNSRFVLEECIGFGGMGTVYKALDLRKLEASDRNPYIAIKVLNVQFRGHPKSFIALQREAKKAQKLAHPNIVTVYDFDRDGSMVYLTMEYLSGQPLSKTLRQPDFKGVPYVEAMRIVGGMGKALAYAHERGFVHCDFKPANVILTDSGEVKVIDFGIARVFQKPEEEAEATVFDPGSLGGMTPAYASPEILEHREPDPRDDIYALACIAYELLTGRHPFDRLPATQARNAGMKPQRPRNMNHRQWRALRAGLAFDRAGRTPTVARFLEEMDGESHGGKYAALVMAGAATAVLIVAGLNYYQEARSTRDSAPAEAVVPEDAAPPVAAPSAPETPKATEAPKLTVEAVTPVLSRVPCSALAPTVRGPALQVQGYLPRSFGTARLKGMLGEIPGVQTVDLDVQQVSDEKCDVIKLFAPYWLSNRQAGAATAIRTQKPAAELLEGDALVLDLSTPGYESYVNVDYFSFDGSVVHLVPSPRIKANQAPPNYAATIGGLGNWVVAPPFGTDLIVLLVTPAPLFDSMRPEAEPAADYLRAVEKQLGKMADKHGADKIAADFVQVTTRARDK